MLLIVQTQLISQISISGNDILALKGTTRTALSPMDDSVMVAIGPGGSNQTWDYRNINSEMFIAGMLEYLEPANGFRSDLFPEANFRQRMSASTEEGSFLIDSYMNVTTQNLRSLGVASDFAGFSFTEISQDDFAPLPMTFGTNWLAVSNDTSDQIGFLTITIDSTWNTVDGSGTLRLPLGDIECLRIREMSKTISSSTFNGVPFSDPDTTIEVSYLWLSRAHLQTFMVDSIDGGMGNVSMMLSGEVTSIKESYTAIPDKFVLKQNYPNPFNPSTTINYSIPIDGNVTLTVYDIMGSEVTVLDRGFKSAGSYTSNFDASNLTSGIYFYRLQAGNFVESKKMILMK